MAIYQAGGERGSSSPSGVGMVSELGHALLQYTQCLDLDTILKLESSKYADCSDTSSNRVCHLGRH